tara:strand:- start:619 stop:927 length:309 start_codon:yes stop_codon:yes gene_type:complete
MPSTRSGFATLFDPNELPDDYFSSDSGDPDYREESADEADELPKSMARDRAEWVVDNQEAIEELYRITKEAGVRLFGEAFLQCGGVTAFAHFVYKHTTPGAV